MKIIIKRLSVLSFIILFLPFFQTCSDKNIIGNSFLKNSPAREVIPNNSFPVNGKNKEYNLSSEELFVKKANAINTFLKCKKDLTMNGYNLSFWALRETKVRDIIEEGNYIFLIFTIVILLCFAQIFYSYKEKHKAGLIISICNLCLSLIPLLLLYLGNFLEDIEQIKYGYYLFLINLLLIIYLSNEENRNQKNGI